MFEKILVCLDGFPLAEEILPYIAEESRHFSKVVLLKVVNPPVIELPLGVPGGELGPVQTKTMLKKFRDAFTKDAPDYLEKQAGPLRAKGLDVETVVLEGTPAKTILDYAAENGVTMLAIATHGHGNLRELTVGSTAEYILKHCGMPVLMVTPAQRGKR
jgi:nucleotide-binding universal stress UspA family protein